MNVIRTVNIHSHRIHSKKESSYLLCGILCYIESNFITIAAHTYAHNRAHFNVRRRRLVCTAVVVTMTPNEMRRRRNRS